MDSFHHTTSIRTCSATVIDNTTWGNGEHGAPMVWSRPSYCAKTIHLREHLHTLHVLLHKLVVAVIVVAEVGLKIKRKKDTQL